MVEMIDYLALTKFMLTIIAVGFVICRLAGMTPRTRRSVRNKYALLCVALIFSLVAPIEWSSAIQGIGLVLFLSYGEKRRNLWVPRNAQMMDVTEELNWPRIVKND